MKSVAGFALSLYATAVSGVVIDSPTSYPPHWIDVGPTDVSSPIELVLAIKQQNVDGFLKHLDDIASPKSEQYGNWMTMAEVHGMVAPSNESLTAVKDWLLQHASIEESDISSVTSNSDFIKVSTTVGVANDLLHCKYLDYMYDSPTDDTLNMKVSRMDQGCDYHVPSTVSDHIDFVSPTKRFPAIKHIVSRVIGENGVGAGEVTPSVLKSLYKIGDVVGEDPDNAQGIASFVRQYYSQTSLENFWKDYDIETDNVTHTDPKDGDGDGIEALLDTQYISSVGELVPLQVWYNEGTFGNAMLDFLTDLQSASNPPNLFSVSYGQPEEDWGASSVERLNVEFAKVTAIGVTIFFASGDSGAGGGCGYDQAFMPEFPASSPYVTSVGGVEGGDANSNPIGESVWVDGGGGFSTIAPTQSWQTDAVSAYLSGDNRLPDSDSYNSTGRGYPDISAQSVDFEIVRGDTKLGVDGTSCASPTAAGVFALLNDLRLQNNMSPLGYMNAFVYETATSDDTAFNDVTSGYNKGCSGFQEGFYAATGWDPASGWGSPNYEVLKTYVLQTGEKTKRWAKTMDYKTRTRITWM